MVIRCLRSRSWCLSVGSQASSRLLHFVSLFISLLFVFFVGIYLIINFGFVLASNVRDMAKGEGIAFVFVLPYFGTHRTHETKNLKKGYVENIFSIFSWKKKGQNNKTEIKNSLFLHHRNIKHIYI